MSGLQKFVTPAMGVGALLLLFVLSFPLTVDYAAVFGGAGTQSFFIQPRMRYLYPVGLLALLALALLATPRWWREPIALLRSSPVLIALLVAALAFASAPLFATIADVATGYRGPFNRGDGALMYLISFALAMLAARVVFLQPLVGWLLSGAYVLVAAAVGAMAAYQGRGGDLWALVGFQGLNTITGAATMGSPVFISVLAGMSLLMGATLALQPLLLARRWSIPLLILALGYLGYAVTAAGGRSALVGTFLTLGVLWLLVIFRATLWPKRTPELRFPALVATGILVAALLGGFIGVQEGRGARNFAALIDVLSSEELTESSTLSRTLFYRAALPALLAQPVRPYGVNSFLEVIWAYADEDVTERLLDIYQYVPEEARATAFVDRSAWVYQDPDEGRWVGVGTGHDKVHNYILDVWLAFGLVPLLALVALLALAFFSMLRSREPLALGAAAAMAVYAIYAQAWFPAPATDPLLFILFGIGWGALERSRRADELEEQERSASRLSRAEWRRLQRAKG